MKYKVGDKVRVRDWDDMKREFGTDEYGIATPDCCFTYDMKKYCNSIVTIDAINDNIYNIKEDNNVWQWCDEMFEPDFHFTPAHKQEKILVSKIASDFSDCSITDETFHNILNYTIQFESVKDVINKYDKEINEMKRETKPTQPKQKTKRERLKEKIAKYKVASGINSIEVIVSNKVVKIKINPMFSHWKSEYKMVCDDQDTFSLERAIYLAYAKDECCGKYTSEYIELYADKLAMEKKFVAKVKAAMKLYECQEELKKLDEEEATMIQRKREKRWKQKERRAERKRNEQIAMQKEAYVQAWKEIEKIKKHESESDIELTEEDAENLFVEE